MNPLFHHCTNLDTLHYGVAVPHPKFTARPTGLSPKTDGFDDYYIRTFRWWERKMGFYPMFLAVGSTELDIRMTGYPNQWCKIIESSSKNIGGKKVKLPNGGFKTVGGRWLQINKLRKAGTFPNYVLLSFDNVDGVFTDFDAWHIAMNGAGNDRKGDWDMKPHEMRQLVKPSWNRADWLRLSRNDPHRVQMLVPQLDFRKACRVWVRNQETKARVEDMGFQNVRVKRMEIERL